MSDLRRVVELDGEQYNALRADNATRDALARAIVAWQEAHFYPADMTVERWREALDAALGPINESEE